jgi:hypothetical protein
MLLFPMKTPRLLRRAVLLATLATGLAAVPEIPDLEGFEDAIHHWQNRYDRADYPRFPPGEVAAIADNILLWQRANGGWKENEDPARILDAEERAAILADRAREDTSFDNRNVWPQVRYLAAAYSRLGDERYRAGCERGIEFVLAGQHPSGGWPHSYPSRENYRPHLTFADDIIPDQLKSKPNAMISTPPATAASSPTLTGMSTSVMSVEPSRPPTTAPGERGLRVGALADAQRQRRQARGRIVDGRERGHEDRAQAARPASTASSAGMPLAAETPRPGRRAGSRC